MRGCSIRRWRSPGRRPAADCFICANHPFVDGNKRVAFAAMDTFLRLNGLRLTLTDDEAFRLTVSVAAGDLNKRAVAAAIRRGTTRT